VAATVGEAIFNLKTTYQPKLIIRRSNTFRGALPQKFSQQARHHRPFL
jgi:hypothetical protein